MSFGTLISVQHVSEDGRTLTVLLNVEGYGGSPYSASVELAKPAYRVDFDEDEIASLACTAFFVTKETDLIQRIQALRFGSERNAELHIKEDAETIYRGYVIPDSVSTPLNDKQVATLIIPAKDRTRSMESEWLDSGVPYDGDLTASVVIADILASTGIPFTSIMATQTWRPGALAFGGDPYSIKIPAKPLYDYRDDGTVTAPTKKQVLEDILGLTLCQLVQWDGEWVINQPGSHYAGETVRYWTYDANGTYTGTSTRAAYVDLTNSSWVKGSDEGRGKPPFRRADVTYEFGEVDNQIRNGDFELWTDPPFGQPLNWTTGGGVAFRAPGLSTSGQYGLGLLSVTTLNAVAGYAALATVYQEQSVPATQTASEQELSFLSELGVLEWNGAEYRPYSRGDYADPVNARAFFSVRSTDGTFTKYLNADGSWTNAGAAEVKISVTLLSGIVGPTRQKLDGVPYTGTVTFRFYQAVHSPIRVLAPLTEDDIAFGAAVWDDIRLSVVDPDDSGSNAITYAVYDADKTEGGTYSRHFLFGDGPFLSAPGAIKYADGTITGDWRPLANATPAFPITELHAREYLRQRRSAQGTIRLTTAEANLNVTPITAVKFDGKRYWPESLSIEQPTGRATLLAREIKDEGVPSGRDVRENARIQVGRSRDGVTIFAALSAQIQNGFAATAVLQTNAVIQAGTRTALPVDGKDVTLPGGTEITLIDSRTANPVDLVVSDNYLRFGPSLLIESFVFEQPFDTGSYIIISPAHALHRIAITENAFNRTMRAGRLCSLVGAVAGTVSSLPVTPLRRDVAAGTVLVIVEGLTGDTDDTDDEQTVQVTTFTAAGSEALTILEQRVDAPDGAHLKEDEQQMQSFFLQNPDQIKLGVERIQAGKAWTTTTANIVALTPITAISINPATSAAKSGDVLQIISQNRGRTENITLAADVTANDESITIAEFTPTYNYNAGSSLRIADQTTRAAIIVNADAIALNVTSISDHTTAIAGLDASVTANTATLSTHTTVLSNNGLTTETNITQTASENAAAILERVTLTQYNAGQQRAAAFVLSALATGTVTSLTVSALPDALKDNDRFSLVNLSTGTIYTVYLSANAAGGATTISIDDGAGSGVAIEAPVGSPAFLLDGFIRATIAGVDTRVTAAEGTISSHVTILSNNGLSAGTNITQRVSTAEGDISAEITARTNITTANGLTAATNITSRVSATETDIGTNATSITTINNTLSTNGISGATNITSRVSTVEGAVDTVEATIVLKAEVTAGKITKFAAVQIDASVAGGSAVTISGEQINLNGNTTVEGTFVVSGANVTLNASTTINGDFVVSGGNVSITSTTTFATDVTIKGNLDGVGGTFSGSLSAATGTFSGSLSAATGTFSGQVVAGTVKIGNDVSGSLDGIYFGASNNWFSDGTFALGGSAGLIYNGSQVRIGSNTRVAGTMGVGTAGNIIWIDGAGLQIYSNNYASGTAGWRLAATSAEFNDVTVRGTVYASAGTFAGSLSAATGTFAGSLSAATGTFAGSLSSADGSFTGSIVVGTTNKLWLNDGADGALNIGGATKASAPFRVTAAGALTATNATITGTVTSSNVTITGGSLNINSGVFQVTSAGALTASSVSITAGGGNVSMDSDGLEITLANATAGNRSITWGGLSGVGVAGFIDNTGTGLNTIQIFGAVTDLASSAIYAANLPTSDPGNTGQLWNDSGTVKVSP